MLVRRLETGDIEFTTKHEALEQGIDRINRSLVTLTRVAAIGLFLLAAGIYVLAAETAGSDGSSRLDTLQILIGIGFGALAISVVQTWRMRRQ